MIENKCRRNDRLKITFEKTTKIINDIERNHQLILKPSGEWLGIGYSQSLNDCIIIIIYYILIKKRKGDLSNQKLCWTSQSSLQSYRLPIMEHTDVVLPAVIHWEVVVPT